MPPPTQCHESYLTRHMVLPCYWASSFPLSGNPNKTISFIDPRLLQKLFDMGGNILNSDPKKKKKGGSFRGVMNGGKAQKVIFLYYICSANSSLRCDRNYIGKLFCPTICLISWHSRFPFQQCIQILKRHWKSFTNMQLYTHYNKSSELLNWI